MNSKPQKCPYDPMKTDKSFAKPLRKLLSVKIHNEILQEAITNKGEQSVKIWRFGPKLELQRGYVQENLC